ncbi:MAG: hypothetical protein E6R03_09295 [Hyphomicrobiaceae bacterium]|nr:MAG: hypothetical protein E6R03_09295 [Hyphomicrobiaceae bacterium]
MLDYSELASSMPRVPRMAPEIGAAPPITHAGMNYGQIGRDAAIGGAGLGAAGAAGGGAYYAMSPEESYANQLRAMANQNLGTDFEQRSRLAAALGR